MKKLLPVIIIVCLLLVSCGGSVSNTIKSDEYQIDLLENWKMVDKGEDSPYEAFLAPEGEGLHANVKIQTQFGSKIKWGRVVELTENYADQAVEEFGYTLVSDKYQFTPQAQREQRYELVFSAEQQGQAFTVVQHIYALKLKVIFVTGTYPENDEALGADVKTTMDSFLLAPKGGWEE